LGGRGRGVKHLPLAVGVGRVDAVEKQGVEVGRKPQVAVGPLNGGDGTGVTCGQAARDVALAVPPGHGVREDAQDLTQQLAVGNRSS
jgi:hypothetical protein